MRLCYNDAFGGQLLRDLKSEDAEFYRDIGFRVAGVNSGDAVATDADIERAKRILDDAGLTPGPFGGGGTTFHPDPAQCRTLKERVAKVLVVAGKLG
jgi:sugar phosphate isomerase/epimerase